MLFFFFVLPPGRREEKKKKNKIKKRNWLRASFVTPQSLDFTKQRDMSTGVISMRLPTALFLCSLLLLGTPGGSRAGDAVMWNPAKQSFVAEYSGTPEGGKDYLTQEQAELSVEKIVRKERAVDPILIWKSDRTGYFAVCTGVTGENKTVAAVGFGKTEVESKLDGLAELHKAGAQSQFYIAYRYASYGHDHAPKDPPLDDLTASPVENEEISSISPDGHYALRTAHSRGWKFRRFDLVDLRTFDLLLELGTPTVLFGSIVWSDDAQHFAFFGEERTYGTTTVYAMQEGKFTPLTLPDSSKFPDPELGLQADEKLFKTTSDMVRPSNWTKSGDLVIEHKVEVVVENNYRQVATAEGTTTMNIHFDGMGNGSIVGVSQESSRKPIVPKATPKLQNPILSTGVLKKPTQ